MDDYVYRQRKFQKERPGSRYLLEATLQVNSSKPNSPIECDQDYLKYLRKDFVGDL